ncbi:MAG: hypothetical protein ACYDAQ_18465 [Mycobacteriales bacterium]
MAKATAERVATVGLAVAMTAGLLTSMWLVAAPAAQAASSCTGPSGVTNVSYTAVGVSGTRTIDSLGQNSAPPPVYPGDTVTAHFTVPAQCANEQVSIATYKTTTAQYNAGESQTLSASQTGTFAAGSYSLTAELPGPPGLLTFGPSSMEGALVAQAGDYLSVGYDFTIPGAHPDTTVTILHPVMTFPYRCAANGPVVGSFEPTLPDLTSIDDPAGSSNWFPSGDQNSSLVYQGVISVPDVCHGGQIYLNYSGSFGATFSAQISATIPGGVHFRFHYRDPRAEGHGNVDCADASAPLANSAVCGASWSSTNGVTSTTNYQIDFVTGPVNSTIPPAYDARKIDWTNG